MKRYAAVILAAGRSSRFRAAGGQGETKLVAAYAGEPVVRHVARAALASKARPVFVVTGHAHEAVTAALGGLPIQAVHNPDFADGLATSLRAGVAVLPEDCAGAVVLLGDMPAVTPLVIDGLIEAAEAEDVDAVVVTHDGQRGNPVLLARPMIGAVMTLTGDAGARALLRDPNLRVVELPAAGRPVLIDIDEPRDLATLNESFDEPAKR